MPLQATSGAASYDAFGGGVPVVPAYIEEVFGTFLYTGTRSTQTITNGIDLSTKGGLVWIKERTQAGYDHALFDTARGVNKQLKSNLTNAEVTYSGSLTSFGTTGFTLGADSAGGYVNDSLTSHASWTFRKQPKFFDIVTYTGDGLDNRTIAHSLGSVPGCMIIKKLNAAEDWQVYHRSTGNGQYLVLNTTAASASTSARWSTTTPTATVFTVGGAPAVNEGGSTYVAYLFAHDAGGFGLTGTDNVISCGSGTSNGSGVIDPVTLGYEPQFVIAKATGTTSHWFMFDTMRGDSLSSISYLRANTSDAETTTTTTYLYPTATGFAGVGNFFGANQPFIYIAIRRGPMKVPTSGTSVFSPTTNAGTGSQKTVTTNFPVDLTINSALSAATHVFTDRLRGGGVNVSPRLYSQFTDAETNTSSGRGILFDSNTGFTLTSNYINGSGDNYIYYGLKRAPSFFDEVCYTGTGSAATINHNLGVVPELIIFKNRSGASNWPVNVRSINTNNWVLNLEENSLQFTSTLFSSAPTSSTMTFTGASVNATSSLYVAYLFATCAGVSKVGSYTGNGTNQTIDCGFTAGARFVLIKRATSGGGATTGDWYVWDSARGIVAGNDPRLSLNTTAAEVTTDDSVDTDNSGFIVNQLSATNINFTSATYIFLAIA